MLLLVFVRFVVLCLIIVFVVFLFVRVFSWLLIVVVVAIDVYCCCMYCIVFLRCDFAGLLCESLCVVLIGFLRIFWITPSHVQKGPTWYGG